MSCHVERPLDDAVWQRYRELQRAAPGRLRDRRRCCGRPAERRGRGALSSSGRARPPRSGRSGITRTGRRRRTRARPAAIRPTQRARARALAAGARARAALLLRRRLVHRRGRARARSPSSATSTAPRRLRGRRSCRRRRRARRSTRPRGSASTTAAASSSCRARTRSGAPRAALAGALPRRRARALPRLRAARRRGAGRADGGAAAARARGAGPSTPARSNRSARSHGRTCAPTDGHRGDRRVARGLRRLRCEAAGGALGAGRRRTRSWSRIAPRRRDGRAQDPGARLRYQLLASGDAAQADEGHLVAEDGGRRRLRGRDRRARPHGDGARCAHRRRAACSRSAPPGDGRAAGAATRSPRRADDHFLGGGERGDGVDLRGQILQIKVA